MSGVKKLGPGSRWNQFTGRERAHIRELYEREGVEEAAAYCRKIGKSWSGSSISRFFRKGPVRDFLPGTNRLNKVRSDSRWWQFTKAEQDQIRAVFKRDGVELAAAYCDKIGKSWSRRGLADFFRMERGEE